MANLLLRRYIEVLIILKLELLEKPDTEEPFRAQIIIGFEPTSIVNFFGLFKPSAVIDTNPLQGMLQIHQIFPEHIDFGGFSESAPFPKSELEKRRITSCLSGLGALPFGFIQFIHGSGEKITISCMDLLIQEESMDLARQANELEIPVHFQGRTTVKKPLSEWTCIELVNALIRQDSKNQWLLRINMEQKHKQMIKDASISFFSGLHDSVPIVSTPTDTSPSAFTATMGPKVIQESVYLKYLGAFLRDHTHM